MIYTDPLDASREAYVDQMIAHAQEPIVVTFHCSCGESWDGAPPPNKLQTREFYDEMEKQWRQKHAGHVFRIVEVK